MIAVYLALNVVWAVMSLFALNWITGVYVFFAGLLAVASGAWIKWALLFGSIPQKIIGPILGALAMAAALWLGGFFWMTFRQFTLTGPVWAWIGFAVGVLFSKRRVAKW